ncbi:Predicted dehydrogenase [Alkalibacterium putridalgicola]|uniref:Oxidoreductase n=1 Tax=Alkalibacterium putridalgicola TaxID=426703 RepID=A0A1H7UKH7_9LACT|nr:Gfo/Idh/MocA family oxidoreductase [Alkalibacterium putridalgicola]GEK88256.1 oxidoreductase [Alkalibacterium putridalgicola]SEL97299.1 Predicted dehydrogenase [Alkalibacterium putridalgicola]
MKKFGWAYIGCGGIARTTAEELVQTEDNEIVAVWNRTQSKAEAFAEEFGGTVYDTPEEAINAPDVEGVYVNVNGDLHAKYTRLSIANGKPVLCEKPFAVNEEVTKEVFDYAAEKDVFVSEAMWTWHNETALKVKEWVKSGVLGDIQAVSSAFEVPLVSNSTNPRLTTPSMLGGALMDLGVYNVRYCYELFGLPEHINCEARMEEVDYSETITFDYPGFKAINFVSMEKEGGHYFEIKGTKGSIYVPQFHMAKTATLNTEDKEETFEVEDLLYGKQFSNVAAEIRAGKKESEKISAKGTIEVMSLLDECRRQMGLVYPQEKQNEEA